MHVILIVMLALLLPVHSYCASNQVAADELHESAGTNIVKHLIEDVFSLLPADLVRHLNADTIRDSVRFNTYNNKWQTINTPSADDLFSIYSKLSIKYANNNINDVTLSDELGNTISTIIEVSLMQGSNDLLGEKFKLNMDAFLRDEYKKVHIIKYDGYDGSDIRTCISRIYELSNYSKSQIYPFIVIRTAQLWTAMHNAKTPIVNKEAKTLIRKPLNIAYTGRMASSPSGQPGTKQSGSQNEASVGGRNNPSEQSSTMSDSSSEKEPTFIILIPVR
jgi:hypothetical protein